MGLIKDLLSFGVIECSFIKFIHFSFSVTKAQPYVSGEQRLEFNSLHYYASFCCLMVLSFRVSDFEGKIKL